MTRARLNEKPSDEVANGDESENKQLENEDDSSDDIVDDNGFAHQWVQTSAGNKKHHAKKHRHHHKKHGHQIKTKKVVVPKTNLHQHHHKKHHKSNEMNIQIDYLMNQHNAFKLNKQNLVNLKDDINSDIGTLPGQTTRGYASILPVDYFAQNKIMAGSHITVPRDEGAQPMRNSALQLYKYSDELANGDSADDREIHEDEDMNDDVVDVNGQTNRGYGSRVPTEYFAGNHIMNGHITVPRDDGAQPMRNSLVALNDDFLSSAVSKDSSMFDMNVRYSDELANGDSADDREIHEEEDMNDDVVDFNGQTNRGYGSRLPRTYFAENHIMEGSHIQVPRDEGPQILRNNAAI